MPNSFFILIPIVFFADLIAIAVGLAYSAAKQASPSFNITIRSQHFRSWEPIALL